MLVRETHNTKYQRLFTKILLNPRTKIFFKYCLPKFPGHSTTFLTLEKGTEREKKNDMQGKKRIKRKGIGYILSFSHSFLLFSFSLASHLTSVFRNSRALFWSLQGHVRSGSWFLSCSRNWALTSQWFLGYD